MRTKIVEFFGSKYKIAAVAGEGMAKEGEYTLTYAGDVTKYTSERLMAWHPGCPKILESNDPELKGLVPDLSPIIRQVWLDLNTGDFSNSWEKDEDEFVQKVINERLGKQPDGWKLIEYTCPNDDKFEFFNLMKIMTNFKNLHKK